MWWVIETFVRLQEGWGFEWMGLRRAMFSSSSSLGHSRQTALDWTLMIATRSDKQKGNYRSCTARVKRERKRGDQGAFFFLPLTHSLAHSLTFFTFSTIIPSYSLLWSGVILAFFFPLSKFMWVRGDGPGTGTWDRGRGGGPAEGNKVTQLGVWMLCSLLRMWVLDWAYLTSGSPCPSPPRQTWQREKGVGFYPFLCDQSTQPRCDDLPPAQSLDG